MRDIEDVVNEAIRQGMPGQPASQVDLVRGLMAEALRVDRAERERRGGEEKLVLKVTREVSPIEVYDLVYSTGALSYPWWQGCAFIPGPHAHRRLHHDEITASSHLRVWVEVVEGEPVQPHIVPLQDIVDAAGTLLAEGKISDDAAESLDLLDSADADIILQTAVLGEIKFG